jgi:hypothetical protein
MKKAGALSINIGALTTTRYSLSSLTFCLTLVDVTMPKPKTLNPKLHIHAAMPRI